MENGAGNCWMFIQITDTNACTEEQRIATTSRQAYQITDSFIPDWLTCSWDVFGVEVGRNGGEILCKSGKVRRFSADVDLHEESRLIVQHQVTKPASLLCRPTPLYSRMAPTGGRFYKMASLSTYSHLSLPKIKVAAKKCRALAESFNIGTKRRRSRTSACQCIQTPLLDILERFESSWHVFDGGDRR